MYEPLGTLTSLVIHRTVYEPRGSRTSRYMNHMVHESHGLWTTRFIELARFMNPAAEEPHGS